MLFRSDVEVLIGAVGFAEDGGANAVARAKVLQGRSGGEQLDVRSRDELFLGAAGVQSAGVGVGVFDQDADLGAFEGVAVNDGVDLTG